MRHRATTSPLGHGRAALGARLTAVASVGVMLGSAVALVSALVGPVDRTPAGLPTTAVAGDARPGAGAPTGPTVSAAQHWSTVLARLDRRRARAYAAAHPGLLRSVYVPGSAVLRRDRRLLVQYARRRLHVRGLRMDVVYLRVRAQRPGRVVLRVRDRVAAGTVVGRAHRRPLPADDLDSRLLTLRRVDRGVWLVAAVRPVRR